MRIFKCGGVAIKCWGGGGMHDIPDIYCVFIYLIYLWGGG